MSKKIALVILVGLISNISFANSIQLKPLGDDNKLMISQSMNVTGSCGSAVVRVLGVEDYSEDLNFYNVDIDSGKIIVRGNNFEFDAKALLSDHNGVSCTKSSKNNSDYVMIWSNCSGSACGDNFSFYFIDPKNGRNVTPKARDNICDAKCASQFLGNNLPLTINELE